MAQYLMLTLGALLVITSVNVLTEQWARRRVMGAALLMLVGMLLAPGKVPEDVISWVISGLVGGVFLLVAYAWVLRSRPALVVFATAAMIVPGLIGSGLDQAYAGCVGRIVDRSDRHLAVVLALVRDAYSDEPEEIGANGPDIEPHPTVPAYSRPEPSPAPNVLEFSIDLVVARSYIRTERYLAGFQPRRLNRACSIRPEHLPSTSMIQLMPGSAHIHRRTAHPSWALRNP